MNWVKRMKAWLEITSAVSTPREELTRSGFLEYIARQLIQCGVILESYKC